MARHFLLPATDSCIIAKCRCCMFVLPVGKMDTANTATISAQPAATGGHKRTYGGDYHENAGGPHKAGMQ
jgi:hypothetical protein